MVGGKPIAIKANRTVFRRSNIDDYFVVHRDQPQPELSVRQTLNPSGGRGQIGMLVILRILCLRLGVLMLLVGTGRHHPLDPDCVPLPHNAFAERSAAKDAIRPYCATLMSDLKR